MRNLTFCQAACEAMHEAMAADSTIFLMGEDLGRQSDAGGQYEGLADRFPGRVINTPISETFIVGGAVGAALAGARPVVDIHFSDFIGTAMDEVLNQMAKIRYMSGGQARMPVVLRASDGMTRQVAAQHSQSLEAIFTSIPGLRVVAPSNPYDAKMVLKAALESDNPVIYYEHKALSRIPGEVPEPGQEQPYTIGKARIVRPGSDVTIVSYSASMRQSLAAAQALAAEGIQAEVIDLISLSPWDTETVLASVRKTGRLCVVHEAVKNGGFGGEIAATVAEEAMDALRAPIRRYGAPFCPTPFSRTQEDMVRVYPEDICKGIREMF